METELPNAERKLDGAIFFLNLLAKSLDEPRAFYHFLTAVLGAVRAIDYTLKNEHCKQHRNPDYETWLDSQLKKLCPSEQRLVEAMFGLRDRDVHNDGLPLSVTFPVEVRTSNIHVSATVKVRKEGDNTDLAAVSVPSALTGTFEDATTAPPRVATPSMMAPGRFTADIKTSTEMPADIRVVPKYKFINSKFKEDAFSQCQSLVTVAERILQEYWKDFANT